jgi:hypothetical protein
MNKDVRVFHQRCLPYVVCCLFSKEA